MIRKNYDFRNLQNNEDYIDMINYSFNIAKCIGDKCKEEYDNLQKKTLEYISEMSLEHKKISDKEKKTKAYKEHEKENNKLLAEYNNNPCVMKYMENVKNNIKNDENTTNNKNQALIKYNNRSKKILRKYHKTAEGKYYKIEYEKINKKFIKNTESIMDDQLKCSLANCLNHHKHYLGLLKNLSKDLCEKNYIKSCKIYKEFDKINIDKITLSQYKKLMNKYKNGLT